MTQDYKARSGPSPRAAARRRHERSCIWWFLLGAMLGSFGVGMAWMLQSPPGPPVATSDAEPPRTRTPQPPPMEFTFHDILPDTRVDVPREEPNSRPPPLPPPPPRQVEELTTAPTRASQPRQPVAPPPKADTGSYLLQIGSFRRSTDADSQKAKLALLGIQARVSVAQVNGVTYHRVISGPYPGKQAAEQTREKLSRNGLKSFATKVR